MWIEKDLTILKGYNPNNVDAETVADLASPVGIFSCSATSSPPTDTGASVMTGDNKFLSQNGCYRSAPKGNPEAI